VMVPAVLASYAIVGERLQGSLEPVLTTPVRREELLLGKATAVFLPAVVVAYLVFGLFVTLVELFAHPAVADALIRGPQLLAQLLFTPLLTAWSLWVGIAVSVRCRDPRTAAQLAILCSLPTVAVTTLLAFDIIPVTTGVAIGLAVVLLVLIALGWRTATAIFDRERLIAGRR
jgi:ABC-type Na+ efflux pump permease subunit